MTHTESITVSDEERREDDVHRIERLNRKHVNLLNRAETAIMNTILDELMDDDMYIAACTNVAAAIAATTINTLIRRRLLLCKWRRYIRFEFPVDKAASLVRQSTLKLTCARKNLLLAFKNELPANRLLGKAELAEL